MTLPVTGSLPGLRAAAVARKRLPSLGEMVGIGAAIGLALSIPIGHESALPLAALGAGLGAWRSFRKVPDAPVCRIPRIARGCGGSTAVVDKRGNSGPPRRCWGHPGGKPKRLVNLAVVATELALAAVLVAVLVTATSTTP